VRAITSAISPGTELLVYRGCVPPDIALDSGVESLSDRFAEPMQYGYSLVGRVVERADDVDAIWDGALVFAFHPHESEFVCPPSQLVRLPADLPPERAAMLANMETATSLIHDGRPLLGERAAVFGQGVLGLLTVSLLARLGLRELIAVDPVASRRELALSLGATHALPPADGERPSVLTDFDLVYEVSGNPRALDGAIASAGYGARVIVASWYGDAVCTLSLGGDFHRNHIQIQSSQVSTISAGLRGRWDKARRLELAVRMLSEVDVTRLVTQRFDLDRAAAAYALLDEYPERALQVLFTYSNGAA
jgi:2-desacetyl-2-hydroxyethyl bacteriochlorophyllide A dehydrogenase